MSDPIEIFFDGLARRGYEPILGHTVSDIQWEILDGEASDHWWVGIDRGKVKVRHGEAPARCLVRQERQTLVDTILGRNNPMSTLLRGQSGFSGEGEALVVFQRLFPDRAQTAQSEPVAQAEPAGR